MVRSAIFLAFLTATTGLEAQQAADEAPPVSPSSEPQPESEPQPQPESEAEPQPESEAEPQPDPEPPPPLDDAPEPPPLDDAPAAPEMPAAQQALLAGRGREVYGRYCATCHGTRGDGRGPTARFSRSRPRDFTGGVYKWRTTPSGALPTDADLLRTVRQGAPGTNMPAWSGRIPDAEIQAVVQYIKTFSPRFVEEGVEAPLPMPTQRPAFDEASRLRGRLLYVVMQCWTCHGLDGTGGGPAAAALVDDAGRRVEAYDFTEGEFRGGRRPIDIYRTFTTGVNGTPMPQYHEALMVGRDGYQDLSQYEEALDAQGMAALRRYVAAMPTTEQIWAMPEAQRLEWAARARWDLVAYVVALARGSAVWRYLWSPLYRSR